MDHRSEKARARYQKFKQTRDLYFAFLLLWMILFPQDILVSGPIILVSYLFVRLIEKKAWS